MGPRQIFGADCGLASWLQELTEKFQRLSAFFGRRWPKGLRLAFVVSRVLAYDAVLRLAFSAGKAEYWVRHP